MKEIGLEVEICDIVAVELTQVPTEQFMFVVESRDSETLCCSKINHFVTG